MERAKLMKKDDKKKKITLKAATRLVLSKQKVEQLNLRSKEKDAILDALKRHRKISNNGIISSDEAFALRNQNKNKVHPSNKLKVGEDNSLFLESPTGLKNVERQDQESCTLVPCYISLPDSSFHQKWDLIMVLVLMYTVIVLPYRIGFDVEPSELFFFVEFLIDIFFWLDIGLSFFTAFHCHGILVTNHRRIVSTYLKTWFIFDLIASIPSVLPYDVNVFAKLAKLPRFLKILKILRLLKFFRAFKLQKMVMYVENHYEIHNGISRIINIFATMCMITHILGCLWHFIPLLESDNENNLDPESWIVRFGLISSSISKRYITSIYWAFTTLTTVGYGDVTGQTTIELIFNMLVILIGVTWYAFVVSSMATVLTSFDSDHQLYREKCCSLNNFCRAANIPTSLRKRLRAYLQYHNHDSKKKQAYTAEKVLEDMSVDLRTEVLMFINRDLIKQIPFFFGQSARLVTLIVSHLKPAFCHTHEYIVHQGDPASGIFYMMRGRAVTIKKSRIRDVHEKGSSFGEIGCVLSDCFWGSVKATLLCEMQVFPIEYVNELMIDHSKLAQKLKRIAASKLKLYSTTRNSVDLLELFNRVNELEEKKKCNAKEVKNNKPNSAASLRINLPGKRYHSISMGTLPRSIGNSGEVIDPNKKIENLSDQLDSLERKIKHLVIESNAKIFRNKELILDILKPRNVD